MRHFGEFYFVRVLEFRLWRVSCWECVVLLARSSCAASPPRRISRCQADLGASSSAISQPCHHRHSNHAIVVLQSHFEGKISK